MNAMHAIICCVIAMLLFDVVVAINVYVVSKATPAISAKNRDNDLNRVKMATRRRLRGHILATQKETLQDEERVHEDVIKAKDLLHTSLINFFGSNFILGVEKHLERIFHFPVLSDEITTIIQKAENSNAIKGLFDRWEKMFSFSDNMIIDFVMKIAESPNRVHAEKAYQAAQEEYLRKQFFLLNVIKAQRIIDIPKIPNLRPVQIDLIKKSAFSFWKYHGMTPDDLSQILVHTEPESDLVKWYESYLLKRNKKFANEAVRSGNSNLLEFYLTTTAKINILFCFCIIYRPHIAIVHVILSLFLSCTSMQATNVLTILIPPCLWYNRFRSKVCLGLSKATD
ncbi:hypothetical protein Plhal304r1_c024g0081691 [Plasmopara halstedii]